MADGAVRSHGIALGVGPGRGEISIESALARCLRGAAAHSMVPLDYAATAGYGLGLILAAHAVGWPVARGGCTALADALASYLRSLGGEIVAGQRVESLAQLPPSRVMLCDITPRQFLRIAGDRLPATYLARLGRYRYGPGVFKMDWALNGPVPWRARECARAGTIHLGGTFEETAASERAPWRGQIHERPVRPGRPAQHVRPYPRAGRKAHAVGVLPRAARIDGRHDGAIERQIERSHLDSETASWLGTRWLRPRWSAAMRTSSAATSAAAPPISRSSSRARSPASIRTRLRLTAFICVHRPPRRESASTGCAGTSPRVRPSTQLGDDVGTSDAREPG